MKTLTGKTALVTGAAAGIGRAIALRLARERVRLVLLDVDVAGLASVAAEARQVGTTATTYQCDLRSGEQISAVTQKILTAGGVDIVVNNAGVASYGPTTEMDAEQWDRVLAINLLAPVQIVRELLPSLLGRSEAHILNVGSLAGLVALPKVAAYNVSKFGLQGLSESLRAEFGRSGLGVTSLNPGFAATGIFDAARQAGSPQQPKRIANWLMTTPEQIAERAMVAIRRNQPLVVVTWLAKLLWFCKRLAPSCFLRSLTSRYKPIAKQTAPDASSSEFPEVSPAGAAAPRRTAA